MLIEPSSTIELYSGIQITNGRQIAFNSAQSQREYFQKHLVTRANNCSYVRRTGRIKVEYPTAQVLQCNYLSFHNPAFENKNFYARIVDFEYVNNVTTDIAYEIDWFQTFCFDAEYHPCVIQREHITEMQFQSASENPWSRNIPEMLTDEGLAVGPEYEKIYKFEQVPFSSTTTPAVAPERFFIPKIEDKGGHPCVCLMLSSIDTSTLPDWTDFTAEFTGRVYDAWRAGFPTAVSIYYIDVLDTGSGYIEQAMNALHNALDYLAVNDLVSAIVGAYVLPRWLLEPGTLNDTAFGTDYKWRVGFERQNVDPKLNTFPYRYIRVETPADTKEYQLEMFSPKPDSEGKFAVEFHLFGSLSGIPVIGIVPLKYRETSDLLENDPEAYNFFERIQYGNFPQMALNTDAFLTNLASQYSSAIMNNTEYGTAALNFAPGAIQREMDISGTQQSVAAKRAELSVANRLEAIKSGALYAGQYMASQETGSYEWSDVGDKFASGMKLGALGQQSLENQRYYDIRRPQMALDKMQAEQAQDVFREAMSSRGDVSNSVFAGTKRAFAANNYRPGSAGGYEPYAFERVGFMFTMVSLNPDILQKYSDYLTCYGYSSLRTKIPNVCDYLKGGTNTPHFVKFFNDTFTYCKTENMEVTGILGVACGYIEGLFNGGCRFLKGDELQ